MFCIICWGFRITCWVLRVILWVLSSCWRQYGPSVYTSLAIIIQTEYTNIYIHIHINIHINTQTYITYTYKYINIHMNIQKCRRAHGPWAGTLAAFLNVHVYMYVFICIFYVYVCIYMYIYVYIYVYLCIFNQLFDIFPPSYPLRRYGPRPRNNNNNPGSLTKPRQRAQG